MQRSSYPWWLMAAAVTFLAFLAFYFGAPPRIAHTPAVLVPLTPSVGIAPAATTTLPVRTPTTPVPREFVEVTQGCGAYFGGNCVNVRSGPGTTYAPVRQLRMGAVVEVDRSVFAGGRTWYHIKHDAWLRYPERAGSNWYIAADYVRHFVDTAASDAWVGYTATTSKRIVIDRSDQRLYGYDGESLIFNESISTGILATPTPRGTFTVYRKTPSRYMQGPIPGISTKEYDLPGVPWNLYFTAEGAVIHGAYWHDKFGKPYSNGCVNLPPSRAQKLYEWAELGMPIVVRD